MTDKPIPTCANCRFVRRPDPSRYITTFGWCHIPMPPQLSVWGEDYRRAVSQTYVCVLHQPPSPLPAMEPQG